MQGAEVALLLGTCLAILVVCVYTRSFGPLFVLLLFGDYLAIQGKVQFGYQILGAYKEIALSLVCCSLLLSAPQRSTTRLSRSVLVLSAWLAVAFSVHYRPFSGLILAGVAGWLVADSRWKLQPNVPLLCLIGVSICAFQFVYVTDMSDLWFYGFLSEAAGNDFATTFNAYFRNERLRPPGFLVSPSTFGLVFVLFSYLVDKRRGPKAVKYATKLLCLAALLMIQTRALLIIFVAYEAQKLILPNLKSGWVVAYYVAVLLSTFAATVFFGDEGALVRIFLYASLYSDLATGMAWVPFGAGYDGPVDSQLVAFVRLFGVPGLLCLLFIGRSLYRQSKIRRRGFPRASEELSFFFVLVFVAAFQWSDSSPGYLLGWLALAFYHQKNRTATHFVSRVSPAHGRLLATECST